MKPRDTITTHPLDEIVKCPYCDDKGPLHLMKIHIKYCRKSPRPRKVVQ